MLAFYTRESQKSNKAHGILKNEILAAAEQGSHEGRENPCEAFWAEGGEKAELSLFIQENLFPSALKEGCPRF